MPATRGRGHRCDLGTPALKWVDYGKMQPRSSIWHRTRRPPGSAARGAARGPRSDPLTLWSDWTDDRLFTCTPVQVDVAPEDRPGRPLRTVECEECGEQVQDGREIDCDGRLLCRACAGEAYYTALSAAGPIGRRRLLRVRRCRLHPIGPAGTGCSVGRLASGCQPA